MVIMMVKTGVMIVIRIALEATACLSMDCLKVKVMTRKTRKRLTMPWSNTEVGVRSS